MNKKGPKRTKKRHKKTEIEPKISQKIPIKTNIPGVMDALHPLHASGTVPRSCTAKKSWLYFGGSKSTTIFSLGDAGDSGAPPPSRLPVMSA